MRVVVQIAVLSVCFIPTVHAQQEFVPRIEFECAGSAVTIDVRKREGVSATREGLVRVVMTATKGNTRAAVRTFEHIDFIGAHCISDAAGNPHIVYQAYCGGSGCDDSSNWGIFDASSLREILTPSDQNVAQAQEIMGVELQRLNRLISVYRVGQALYAEQ